MSLKDDINLLRNVEMFSNFEDEHLRLIAFGSQKMSFAKGYELYHEDQATDGGYVIISGSIELLSYKDEQSKTLKVFKAGSLLGEMALISMNKRVGTAVLREECELMKIPRTVMHRVLTEYPDLAVGLKKRISAAFLSFTKDLDRIRF